MRKHFLILMLLSLLPLAGWAQIDISGVTPTITTGESYYYTNSTPTITLNVPKPSSAGSLTETTEYTLRYYNADQEEINKSAVKAVGTYWVAAVGTGEYEGVSVKKQFNIVKMPLVLTGTPGTKVYGTAADGTIFDLGTTGTVKTKYNSPSAILDLTSTLKTKITYSRAAGTAKADYAISATITDEAYAKNYSIAPANITTDGTTQAKYSITAKDFVEGTGTTGVTITIDDEGITYTGAAQEAKSITVVDNALGTTLVKGTDYTVAYTGDKITASTTQGITITGKGNYDTDGINKTYTIKPATIMVKPIAKKVYDGTNALPTAPTGATENTTAQGATGTGCYFKFQGLVNNEAESIIIFGTGANAPTWTWNVAGDATANVGTAAYVLKIANADVNTAFTATNYTFVAQTGSYTITQKDLTAVAKAAQTHTYGQEENYVLDETYPFGNPTTAETGDVDALKNAIKVVKAATAETTGANIGKFKLTPEYRTDAEIEAYVNANTTLTAEQKTTAIAAAKTAKGNYNLKTKTPGYLTDNKAPLTIALNEEFYTQYYKAGKLQKTYDGAAINPASWLNKEDGLTISGKINEDDQIDLSGLTITVSGTDNGNASTTPYTLQLSGATADDYNISYVASTFTINKRTLTIKIADQTFVNGAVATINQNAYTITDEDEDAGIAEGDEGKVFKLAFATGVVDGDGKLQLTANATPYDDKIEAVDVTGDASKWANYNVSQTKGKITAIAATAIVLDQTVDKTATLTANKYVAATDNKCTVSFPTGQRTLKKETWNTLVLPFDITVAELSQKFGYAVVDVIDETNSDANKVIFKIHMSEIPANTPFMIKVYKDTDLNNIVFSNVKIADPATATLVADDAAGNKLTGSYKPQAVAVGEYYMSGAGNWKLCGESFNIGGERAKFTKSTASTAREFNFFIEEADGTVTAIQSITAEGEAVPAEGWYTLKGVKLQGAPTEKGVYINNGKKVVIK